MITPPSMLRLYHHLFGPAGDMPVGHGHVVLDTNDLPRLFREIFAHSLLKDA